MAFKRLGTVVELSLLALQVRLERRVRAESGLTEVQHGHAALCQSSHSVVTQHFPVVVDVEGGEETVGSARGWRSITAKLPFAIAFETT